MRIKHANALFETKIYNLVNLTSGEHDIVVNATEGCQKPVCYKQMTYKFTVAG